MTAGVREKLAAALADALARALGERGLNWEPSMDVARRLLAQPKVAAAVEEIAPEPVAHNHTRFRNVDGGPWSPCPVSCPAAGLLR